MKLLINRYQPEYSLASSLLVSKSNLYVTVKHSSFPTAFQYSTINALVQGYFDGSLSFAELSQKGDVKLGIIDGLDCEMIALGGADYRIDHQGLAQSTSILEKMPAVIPFQPRILLALPEGFSYLQLQQVLDKSLLNNNHIQPIRINGHFYDLKVRSGLKQAPPYLPPVDIIKTDRIIFKHQDTEGTLVGFKTPDYMNNLNVPSYHFHFINNPRKFGGHALNLKASNGDTHIASAHQLKLRLPNDPAFNQLNLSRDQLEDLEIVEKGH
ncbi:acetolactate decarboxylase [Endozoicomonas elysicola]|uniref:Alpha-acetolactate decarboxylase n=1 Tax=Endozoicomonas elysicola TaxID=305900 RepID=A0A081KFS3_9GAMM|nr:acetolactate decarboxylase [Endozoicomonas elysicola]KEI72999.1 hypothetical protein GV64_21795 [Endozoicomonas elysicola]